MSDPPTPPTPHEDRQTLARLIALRAALWDERQRCRRAGYSDTRVIVPLDKAITELQFAISSFD